VPSDAAEDARRYQRWQLDALRDGPPGSELLSVGPFQVVVYSTDSATEPWVALVDPAQVAAGKQIVAEYGRPLDRRDTVRLVTLQQSVGQLENDLDPAARRLRAAFDCTSVNSDLIYPLSIERYALVGEKRAPAQYRQGWVVIPEQPFRASVSGLYANAVMSAILHRHLDVLRNKYDSI